MGNFLRDSYNGIYVVVLKPYMPRAKTLLLLVIGVIIGLIWAYGISPTIYYDADPSTLEQSWQDEWVKLLADRYAAATADISDNIVDLLRRIDDPLGVVDRLIVTPGEEANRQRLEAIRPFAEVAQPDAVSAPQPNLLGDILPFIIAPLVVAIVAIVVSLLWGLLIKGNVYDPIVRRMRGEKESPELAAARQQRQVARKAEENLRTNFASTGYGPPLMQRMSTYILGHGQYDDSFSIEDANERFLGECGAAISETIGVGDPQKATAIEVWLFDKDDFVRTVTKVFASAHAFNDPALRAKLETRGDLVLAEPGAVIVLETASLRLQARIADMEYGTAPLPPQSYFQKLTIELAAWRKEPGVPAATGAPQAAVMAAAPIAAAGTLPPTYAPAAPPPPPVAPPAQYTPPPPAPAPPVQMPAPPPTMPAYSPPPRPPEQDDDPFGGTGDFTPIS